MVAGGATHKRPPADDIMMHQEEPANTDAKNDHHIAIYFIDSPQQTDDRLILSDKTNGQEDYSFQHHLQTPSSPPCYSTDHMLRADQRHYNSNNGSPSSSQQQQQHERSSSQQQQQHERSSNPPRRRQSRRRRLAAAVPFVRKIKWGPLWDKSKEWIKNPMNMALFVWIVAVGISGAILFMVMTGMLNAVLRTKSQKDTWFEVNNQILNALFTLMCLYNHPRRFYHLALLCRWRAGDMAALREVYCKGGTVKPNERRHMMVVVLLLHLNCLAQYALCGLNLGLSRNRRPPVGVGLTVTVAICAPAVASMYNNLSPLGKDYEVQAADDEEQESSSSGSRQRLQHKTVERRYSFSPSPPQRQGLEMGAAGAVVVEVGEEEEGTVAVAAPEWSGGLVWDLWEDISLAYLSLFCSCCVFGWNAGRLGFGNAYVHAATFILLCLAPFFIFTLAAINIDDEAARLALSLGGTLLCVLGLLYGGFWRIQMRRRFGLPGSGFCCGRPDVTDCFQWLCCCPCALAQEVRTADAYDIVHHRMVSRRQSQSRRGDDAGEEEASSSRVQMQQPLRFAGVFASDHGGVTNTNSNSDTSNTSTTPPALPVGIQRQ
ncbi:hypothetical protein CFC21_045014 [Triticum aestivum]|uniref:PLAC8 family protein n=2 Tax=Triticum aestivum TaxID=4565 RepID=A0A9R1JY98_WHEAT|nr:uncharacterized protein LOC123067121 [Triticum aestivum]KAF7033952.1 hypothetical protein CFC21_045014 [Triticum aestivum]